MSTAIQFDATTRNAILDAIETSLGTSPHLKFRTGALPANCAAADSGTVLCDIALPSDWMSNASAGVKAKSGTWSGTAVGGGGTIKHFREYTSGGTCKMQGEVSHAASAWLPSTAYTVGDYAKNGGKVYICSTSGTSAGSGGPTGTGTAIADGSAAWDYVEDVGALELDTNVVTDGQAITVTGFTLAAGNA